MNHYRFITAVALVYRAPFAISCRAALCLSGHIRSFVYPVVHRSIRRNLIEAIEADGCHVDVFAYATLEDNTAHPKEVSMSYFGLVLILYTAVQELFKWVGGRSRPESIFQC